MDRKRMENGAFLGEDYFERLLEEIREIRLSERDDGTLFSDHEVRAALVNYSTVTDFARLRGLSTSQPREHAM